MEKIAVIVICILLAIVILGCFLYVAIGRNIIENKMWDYLKQENYRAGLQTCFFRA